MIKLIAKENVDCDCSGCEAKSKGKKQRNENPTMAITRASKNNQGLV